MPFPAALTERNVTWTLLNNGTPVQGVDVVFTPATRITNVSGVTTSVNTKTVQTDSSGTVLVALATTDDVDTNPQLGKWTVSTTIDGVKVGGSFDVPSAATTTINLASLVFTVTKPPSGPTGFLTVQGATALIQAELADVSGVTPDQLTTAVSDYLSTNPVSATINPGSVDLAKLATDVTTPLAKAAALPAAGSGVVTRSAGGTYTAGTLTASDIGAAPATGIASTALDTATQTALAKAAGAVQTTDVGVTVAPLVVPNWAANTTYRAGQAVVAPDGTTVYKLATGSTAATYNAAQFKRPPAALAAPATPPVRRTLATQVPVSGDVVWGDLDDIRTPDEVDVRSFGAVGDGAIGSSTGTAGTVNDQAFADCIAFCKNFGKGMYISAGVYNTTQTVDARAVSVRGPYCSSGADGAAIQQMNTSGVPTRTVMIVGGANRAVSNLYLAHLITPGVGDSDAAGAGLRFISAGPQFLLANIFTYKTTYGFYCLETMDGTGRNFMYSCTVHTLRSLEFSRGAGWFGSWNAGNTGSVFSNLYASNTGVGNSVSTPGFTASNAYWIFGGGTGGMTDELSVDQINVEWGKSQYAIKLMGVNHATIRNIHLEGWVPTASTGNTAAVVYASPDSNTKSIHIDGLFFKSGIIDSTFLPSGADLALVMVNRKTLIEFGAITFTNIATPNTAPVVRRHRFSKDGSGSSSNSTVLYRGGILGTPPTIADDTIDSGVTGVNVIDLAGPSTSAVLPAPTGVTASTAGGTTTVTWSAVTGALSYAVHRKARVGGTYSLIGYTSTASFTDAGVGSSPDFVYQIAALPWAESDGSNEVRSNGLANDGSDLWAPNYGSSTGTLATVGGSDFTIVGPTYTTTGSEVEPPGAFVQANNVLHVATGATSGAGSGADNVFIRPAKAGFTSSKNWRLEAEVMADPTRPAVWTVQLANVLGGTPSYVRFKIGTVNCEFAYKTPSAGTATVLSTATVNPGITGTYKRAIVELIFNTDGTATMRYTLAGVPFEATIPGTDAAALPAGAVQMTFSDNGSTATPYVMSLRSYPSGADGLFKLTHGIS